jgi:hypothetical protein
LECDHRNPKENQQEETPNQGERKRRCKSKPQNKRNGDTPLGYSGRTALRREQCDEMPESRNRGDVFQVTDCKSLHDNS